MRATLCLINCNTCTKKCEIPSTHYKVAAWTSPIWTQKTPFSLKKSLRGLTKYGGNDDSCGTHGGGGNHVTS